MNWHALARALGRRAGFQVRRMPRPLLERPDRVLEADLESMCALVAMRRPEVFFVQVGANDGVHNDPFLALAIRLGWRGVLVEPQPDVFDRLTRRCASAAGLTCVNAALDRAEGTRELFRVKPDAPFPTEVSGLASFDRDHLIKHDRQFPGIADWIEGVTVACETFDSLLARTGESDFDVLQVDVEGFDAEVVAMADLGARRTCLVNFEHKHLSRADWDRSVAALLAAGFKVHRSWQDTLAYRAAPEGGHPG